MVLRTRGGDGQLASGDEPHDVGVVGIRWVNRHEAGHAVDVAADADVDPADGDILSVAVHGQSSADAIASPLLTPQAFVAALYPT